MDRGVQSFMGGMCDSAMWCSWTVPPRWNDLLCTKLETGSADLGSSTCIGCYLYMVCINSLMMPSLMTGTFEFIKCHWPVLDRFIPESARWLLGTGRTTEAKQLIKKAAAINKRTVPNYLLDQVPFTTFTSLCIEA